MSLRAISAAVAGLGLAIAAYLVYVHYSGGEPVCAIAQGCAVVQSSRYASLAGVPVALLGLLGYAVLLAALAVDRRDAVALVSLSGAGFSGWLTYVEVAILEAICLWCVASAACMAVLALLSVRRLLVE
jgi:uncharacterized membrane protein